MLKYNKRPREKIKTGEDRYFYFSEPESNLQDLIV